MKKIRNSDRQFVIFGTQRGSGGYAPCKQILSRFRKGKGGEIGACEGTQAVLAILLRKGDFAFRSKGKRTAVF